MEFQKEQICIRKILKGSNIVSGIIAKNAADVFGFIYFSFHFDIKKNFQKYLRFAADFL